MTIANFICLMADVIANIMLYNMLDICCLVADVIATKCTLFMADGIAIGNWNHFTMTDVVVINCGIYNSYLVWMADGIAILADVIANNYFNLSCSGRWNNH